MLKKILGWGCVGVFATGILLPLILTVGIPPVVGGVVFAVVLCGLLYVGLRLLL